MTKEELRELFKDVVLSGTETARQVALEYALDELLQGPSDSEWIWADRFMEEFPHVVEAMNRLEVMAHRDGKFDCQLCLRIGVVGKRMMGLLSNLSTYRRGYIPSGPFGEPRPFVPKEK